MEFNVGDTIYKVNMRRLIITKHTVIKKTYHENWREKWITYKISDDVTGNTYFDRSSGHKLLFKTKEEAENKIEELRKMKEKKKLLQNYETELNEKFNLTQKFIK